jgi:hypothetical protein
MDGMAHPAFPARANLTEAGCVSGRTVILFSRTYHISRVVSSLWRRAVRCAKASVVLFALEGRDALRWFMVFRPTIFLNRDGSFRLSLGSSQGQARTSRSGSGFLSDRSRDHLRQ